LPYPLYRDVFSDKSDNGVYTYMKFFRNFFLHLGSVLYNYVGGIKESRINALYNDYDGYALDLRRVFWGNAFANLASVVMNGVFFTGLILILLKGESDSVKNAYVGTIVSIQTACGVTQIFAPALIERLKSRKTFVFTTRLIYYGINGILLPLVPLLPLSQKPQITLFIVLMVIMQVSISINSPAISAWHITYITPDRRADFFSMQQMIYTTLNAVTSVSCAFLLDRFEAQGLALTGILVLRGAALVFIGLECNMFFRIREVSYPKPPKLDFLSIFSAPIKNKGFLQLVLIGVAYNFTVTIQGQYFVVYLLEEAKMSYTFYTFMTIFALPILLIMLPVWNKLIKRLGWFYALALSLILYAFPQLFNMLITEQTVWIYPILCIYTNFVSPGLTLGMSNLPFMRMPEESKSSCLAFYSTAVSLAGFAGAFFGKYFVQWTEGKYLHLFGFAIGNRLYHFFISFTLLVILAAVIFSIQKREQNSKDKFLK